MNEKKKNNFLIIIILVCNLILFFNAASIKDRRDESTLYNKLN